MNKQQHIIPRWGIFEIQIKGPKEGNPYVDQWIYATFKNAREVVTIDGFYDGNGIYKIRFMPSLKGLYTYEIRTSFEEYQYKSTGEFMAGSPEAGNHGPVRVANTYHLAYEDGTPYYCIGTTCYVWELQSDERMAETLESLKKSSFNKIRFCILPKHYDFNLKEPRAYPYKGIPMDSSVLSRDNFYLYDAEAEGNSWDFDQFNPEYFQHIENCIEKLSELGIEADLIIMHPYDRWGFSKMNARQNEQYLRYIIARFSAYRNVWWSLANEYDLCKYKTLKDWESYGNILWEKDPYHHMCSIHNCKPFYDFNRPWITHCSIQRQDFYKTAEYVDVWREQYGKPVILDEIAYEGNVSHGWGNITGEELVRRFWEAACRGGYAGHGETYMHPQDILWWSHGGKLHGESHKRAAFLLNVLQETPGIGLRYAGGGDEVRAVPEETWARMNKVQDYYLIYYSFMRPSCRTYYFDDETQFRLYVLDTWNMTKEDRGIVKGKFTVDLPGRPYMAIQLKKVTM